MTVASDPRHELLTLFDRWCMLYPGYTWDLLVISNGSCCMGVLNGQQTDTPFFADGTVDGLVQQLARALQGDIDGRSHS